MGEAAMTLRAVASLTVRTRTRKDKRLEVEEEQVVSPLFGALRSSSNTGETTITQRLLAVTYSPPLLSSSDSAIMLDVSTNAGAHEPYTSPTSLAITHSNSYKPSRRGQVPLSYYFFRTGLFMKAKIHRATAVSLVLAAGMHIGPPISVPLTEASTPPCTDEDLEETIHPLYAREVVSRVQQQGSSANNMELNHPRRWRGSVKAMELMPVAQPRSVKETREHPALRIQTAVGKGYP
ncbi:hypothetical protein JOM56_013048 [Amanita muscaria]